jgi:hypothetical protein
MSRIQQCVRRSGPEKFGGGVSSPSNPTFGTPSFAAAARQAQLAMRLNF